MQRLLSGLAGDPPANRAPQRCAPWWLINSAILVGAGLGFYGYLRFPTEERFLYGSLVLSGTVAFPDQALMLLYYRGVWTLLDQLGALAFSAGMSFSAGNLAFLWMPPAFLTSALAMLAYGFTGRPLFSLLLAIICFLGGSLLLDFGSPDYPAVGLAWYAPNPHSYGRFGQLLAAFAFAALIGGREALARLHRCLPDRRASGARRLHIRNDRRRICLWMAVLEAGHSAPSPPRIGCGTCHHRGKCSGVPDHQADDAGGRSTDESGLPRRLLLVLGQPQQSARDDDRARSCGPRIRRPGTSPLALLILRRTPRTSVDIGAVALLGAIVASSLLYFMQHWAPAFLPAIVTRVIPGRLMNIQAALGMALLVSMIVFAWDEAAHRFKSSPSDASSRPLLKLGDTILLRHRDGMAAILLVLLAIGALPRAVAVVDTTTLDDDSPFWSSVREQKITGLVLAPAGLAFKALRYGHLPIALDAAAFNFVNYLPRTATTFGRIMERGYGISFFDPPASVRLFVGSLPTTAGQRYWACLSPEHWKQIAQELGIAALLVPADWAVRLPPLVRDSNYALYAMPREMSQQRPTGAAELSCGLDRE